MKHKMAGVRTTRSNSRSFFRPCVERLEARLALAAFNVNTLLDTDAVDLTTGIDSNGNVSLRSAIEAANDLGGSNSISLPAGIYKLTGRTLDIRDDLTIIGAPGAVVDAQRLSGVF